MLSLTDAEFDRSMLSLTDDPGPAGQRSTNRLQPTIVQPPSNQPPQRYIVIPERPAGTEGWDEARLAALVTRDSVIGVRRALAPEQLVEGEGEGEKAAALAVA
jgi:hypothetical protein